jgi:hypothetical protein
MSLNDVVMKIVPELKKALIGARYYVVEEQKKNTHPSMQDISQKFQLLADAEESEIEEYVIRREETARRAALQMIAKSCLLPGETINRYTHPCEEIDQAGNSTATKVDKINRRTEIPKATLGGGAIAGVQFRTYKSTHNARALVVP